MVNEALKQSFHNQVVQIMNKEWSITNNGVQKQFKKFVLHLEKIMTHPRIINQFTLSLQKFKKDTGTETEHHLTRIVEWIEKQPKNY